MFSQDNTFDHQPMYVVQHSKLVRILPYLLVTIELTYFIRQQIPNIRLVQLIPGFIIFTLAFFFSFCYFSSFYTSKTCQGSDYRQKWGIKNLGFLNRKTQHKLRMLVFSICNYLCSIFFLPLGLQYATSYNRISANAWAVTEFFTVEFSLIFLTNLFYLFPFSIIYRFNCETKLKKLVSSWKFIWFFNLVLAAIVTPTVDGITQLTYFFFFIILSYFYLLFLQKRFSYQLIKSFSFLV